MINLTGYEIANTTMDDFDRRYIQTIGFDESVSLDRYHQELISIAKTYDKWYHFFKSKQKVLIHKDRVLARKLAEHGFKPVIWTF